MKEFIKNSRSRLVLILGIGFITAFMYISGIGCPIKFLTGASCAGCGMSRAWVFALRLQWREAFSYHPLFWLLPFMAALFLFQDKISDKKRKVIWGAIFLLFGAVYLIRLFHPDDLIVKLDAPRIRKFFDFMK